MRPLPLSNQLILGWIGLMGCAFGVACGGSQSAGDVDPTCPSLPADISGSPSTIPDAIGMANALFAASSENRLSIDCFIKRLDRPLTVLGVTSDFSLQPAVGARSPRIFVFVDGGGLVLSIAPAGMGSPYLELAEYASPLRSIKGQMTFPMTEPVAPAFPYDDIRVDAGTTCGGCHTHELPAPRVTVTQGFESDIFRPAATQIVPLPYLRTQADSCDAQHEPYRCAMLRALFDHGNVVAGSFPSDAPLFGE
jgi:hypothetical protein